MTWLNVVRPPNQLHVTIYEYYLFVCRFWMTSAKCSYILDIFFIQFCVCVLFSVYLSCFEKRVLNWLPLWNIQNRQQCMKSDRVILLLAYCTQNMDCKMRNNALWILKYTRKIVQIRTRKQQNLACISTSFTLRSTVGNTSNAHVVKQKPTNYNWLSQKMAWFFVCSAQIHTRIEDKMQCPVLCSSQCRVSCFSVKIPSFFYSLNLFISQCGCKISMLTANVRLILSWRWVFTAVHRLSLIIKLETTTKKKNSISTHFIELANDELKVGRP